MIYNMIIWLLSLRNIVYEKTCLVRSTIKLIPTLFCFISLSGANTTHIQIVFYMVYQNNTPLILRLKLKFKIC